jgi:hypothetical protein
MKILTYQKRNTHNLPHRTDLFSLVEAVSDSVRPEEAALVPHIVSHMLKSGKVRPISVNMKPAAA